MQLDIYLGFLKITSRLRSDTDLVLLATVMNLFVLAELTTKSHPWQYLYTGKGDSKSVRSLIQPNLGTNWFERLLEMPIVHLNYVLRQLDSFYYLSYKHFMVNSSILDIRSDVYAKSIRDNCKNLQDDTIS
jgi:hypothetical protein